MIVVAGEALIDLVLDAGDDTAGSVDAVLGGAPYNTARAAARLGADVRFVGGLSVDRFGRRLADGLEADGVRVDRSTLLDSPTTLAAAEISTDGSAAYRFYFEGTSAPSLPPVTLADAIVELGRAATGIFFTGGLGLVLEPMASTIRDAVDDVAESTIVVVDVNCRPAVIGDRESYVANLGPVLARADVVKASDEDLHYLHPDVPTVDAARRIVDGGARVVVVTAGSTSTTIVDRDGESVVPVPPISAEVVDTIGAGDTFGAGVLAWWEASRLERSDVDVANVERAVRAGHAAAAVVVTRRGADPPRLAELDVDWPTQTR